MVIVLQLSLVTAWQSVLEMSNTSNKLSLVSKYDFCTGEQEFGKIMSVLEAYEACSIAV